MIPFCVLLAFDYDSGISKLLLLRISSHHYGISAHFVYLEKGCKADADVDIAINGFFQFMLGKHIGIREFATITSRMGPFQICIIKLERMPQKPLRAASTACVISRGQLLPISHVVSTRRVRNQFWDSTLAAARTMRPSLLLLLDRL